MKLQGKFLLNSSPSRAVIFLEGPPPGVDILVNSFIAKHADKMARLSRPIIEVGESAGFLILFFFLMVEKQNLFSFPCRKQFLE